MPCVWNFSTYTQNSWAMKSTEEWIVIRREIIEMYVRTREYSWTEREKERGKALEYCIMHNSKHDKRIEW